MKIIRASSREFQKLLQRSTRRNIRLEERVRHILEDVQLHGDEALLRYTRRFDKVRLTSRTLPVSQGEASAAFQAIDPKLLSQLKIMIENVTRFYKRQSTFIRSWKMRDGDTVFLGNRILPLDSVGVYIPAGQVPLVSTVYMTVIPAQVAGVRRIAMATPPGPDGRIDPHILVVANLLKVQEIYKMGGAQAVAALAYGTKAVQRVDKIVGPGNDYVTEAKRQLFGRVAIDMTAGPSELVVVANQFSNPVYVASDLTAQAEHAGSLVILVTSSRRLARSVKKQPIRGYIVLVKNTEEAIEVANQIAPEHMEILVKEPNRWLKRVRHAGAIFLGPYSPVAVGDYYAGPSHVLPTRGSARFFSGLSVLDFVRSSSVISFSRKALEKALAPIEEITKLERLKKHFESVKVRFDQTTGSPS